MKNIENKKFKSNSIESVNLDFIFIENEGTWFFSKDDADKGNYKTGNETGLYFIEKEINNNTMFKQLQSNCWD